MRAVVAILVFAGALHAADPPEYTEAFRLLQQQKWVEAHRQIRELLARYPGNPKVLNLQGLAFLGEGKSPEAIAAFDQALRSAPGFFPALKNLAIHEWDIERQPAAQQHLEAALKLAPNDPVLNVYAALDSLEQKNYPAAKGHLQIGSGKISALQPFVEFRLAVLLASNERYAEAATHFESVLGRVGESYDVRYNLGLCHLLAGHKEGAAHVLEELRKRRKTSEIDNLLARVYEGSNRTQEAVEMLREAISLDPADELNYLDLSILCIDHNLYRQGLEVIEAGLSINRQSQRLIFQRGLLHSLLGQFGPAESDFEESGRLAPESQLPHAGLSLAAIQRSQLPDAIAMLRKRLRDQKDDAVLRYLLGWALVRMGAMPDTPESEEAQSAFENAIRLDPKLPYPYVELGKMYLKSERVMQAIPLLEKALELAPKERSAFCNLAAAYRRSGQAEKAKKVMQALLRLSEQERNSALLAIQSVKQKTELKQREVP